MQIKLTKINNKANLENVFALMKLRVNLLTNGEYIVTINRIKSHRTIPQNKLYRLWLKLIADETGHTDNDLHAYFKAAFLEKQYKVVFSEQVEIDASTTRLSTKEFTTFLDNIYLFASETLGIILPKPDDIGFNEFYTNYLANC
ncbi:MAG TPA: hypothetical protein PLS84_12085 [Salinivirgaceae bacterium]|nr:hypothetical protein [Salinivirgaceae bacterium]